MTKIPEFRMTAESKEDLEAFFKIIFGEYNKAVGYSIRPSEEGERWDPEEMLKDPADAHVLRWKYNRAPKPRRLVFMWTSPPAVSLYPYHMFPFEMDYKGCADWAHRWLQSIVYGNEPDIDGHNVQGWTAYNEGYGHIDGEYAGFLAVAPAWISYNK